jgi:hypothetical protein
MAKKSIKIPKNILKITNPLKGEKPNYLLHILNQKYEIFEADMSETTLDGVCFAPNVRKILVDSGSDPFEKLDTIFHEMFHAILFEFGIKDKHPEKIISILAAGLAFQLTDKRNKNKFKELIETAESHIKETKLFKRKIAAKKKTSK